MLTIALPTRASSPRWPAIGFVIAVALVGCRRTPAEAPRPTPAPAPAKTAAAPASARTTPPASLPAPASAPGSAPAAAAAAPASTPAAAPADDAALERAGLKRLRIEVSGPLETAVVREVGETLGPRLVQVIVRPLVWWLAVPGDLVRGDQLELLYQERPGEDPIIHAVRYHSQKKAQTYRAYRFKPAGAQWPHFYSPDGAELEQRFAHAPLDDYEQVTSLVHDGRGHKGVDFKTPIGTPIKAPFEGRVARKNWHFKGNGNCLELHEAGGRGLTALFLHLAEPPSVAVGAHVATGQVVAKSGNTGRSFAPHLHFQVMQGGKVLDPYAALPAHRRKLAASDQPRLAKEIARLDALLAAR
jgi:murein DD-endopeptidase